MINCRFCKFPMLPCSDILIDSDADYQFYTWECHMCPATVKQRPEDPNWFSIQGFYNGSWYEISQSSIDDDGNTNGPYLYVIKITPYINSWNEHAVKSEFVMELNQNIDINPQNINQKLATILTFS